MDPTAPLTAMDPRPISSPQGTRPSQRPVELPPPDAGIALHMVPGSEIPNHPGSTMDVPRPSTMHLGQQPAMPMTAEPTPLDIRALKASCQLGLREYLSLQNQRHGYGATPSAADLDGRLRSQARVVLGDLGLLQAEVRRMGKEARNHRWRKWLLGGGIALFIPAVRKIFRRKQDDEESASASNDTEYAFQKSKGLLSRIKQNVLGKGYWATLAFFVFAVLYVFQNEVSLRVSKTLDKRIRKICARIENGEKDIEEKDLATLDGWRWRILLW